MELLRSFLAFIFTNLLGFLLGIAVIVGVLFILPGFAGGWVRNLFISYTFVVLMVLVLLGIGILAIWIRGRN